MLLIRRKHEPFEGRWAIPGGFMDMDEPLDAAAKRKLKEQTGVEVAKVVQLHTFDDLGRDPRGRVIAVAYLARVKPGDVNPTAADHAAEVGWHRLDQLPRELAFDHDQILVCARRRLGKATKPRATRRTWGS